MHIPALPCPCTSPAPASPELHDQCVHGQPPPSAGWTWTRAGRAPCFCNLMSRARLRQVRSQQCLNSRAGHWHVPWERGSQLSLPSCMLPFPTASPRKQPTVVTNTLAAQSLLLAPEPRLCLLRPLHSPLDNPGSGTRFDFSVAAGDSGHIRTPPVPAEGTVSPHHFQLLSSVLAGGACGEQPVNLLWVTWRWQREKEGEQPLCGDCLHLAEEPGLPPSL